MSIIDDIISAPPNLVVLSSLIWHWIHYHRVLTEL